jgi:streptogramin lyase
LHENREGSFQSGRLIFATYFSAGVRVYDLEDPDSPHEIAHWISQTPPGQAAPQSNDLFVDREGLIWVTDRMQGGLFVLEPEGELAALI